MKTLLALALAAAPLGAAADYLGPLKPPPTSLAPSGLYSLAVPGFAAPVAVPAKGWDNGQRFKLGYRYSRYLSVESELAETRVADPFGGVATLRPAFRSTGFGLDTVATLPAWGFSFYGRMGAWHGERAGFASPSTALLGDGVPRGTRWRYGLGMRYDFTRSLGVRAELERYSSAGLGSPLAGEGEADQLSIGLSWRF